MIAQYVNYLITIKGYSMNTAIAYSKDLKDFAHWAQRTITGARWSTITRTDIDHYIADMVASELAPSTTNRRLSAISGIYRWFKREGLEVKNPCQFESRRKQGERVPNTIPKAELKLAYENAVGVVKIMLGLLGTTGIRIQELLDLRWHDIDYTDNSLRVIGKGNKQRKVYTTPDMLKELHTISAYNEPSDIIFKMTQRDARRAIWEALKPYSQAPQLSPHAIRHTFATNMAANGVNCTTLAKMLGHNDLNTTQKYIDQGQLQAQQSCLHYALFH